MEEYEEQAQKFLKDTNTTLKVEFVEHGKHFEDDEEERDIYLITLQRGERTYEFKFGQSIANSGLRLFRDKEKKKKTEHNGFTIPKEIRNSYEEFLKSDKSKLSYSNPLRRWFEKEHFNLSGLTYDLGEEPTAYDVLSCLTKYDPDTFEEFCSSYGYEEDSRKAEKIYFKVRDEFKEVRMLWSDEQLEELQKIE